MKILLTVLAAAIVLAAGFGTAAATLQGSAVSQIDLPLKLPAVGNIEAVKQWRFGRIQQVDIVGGSADIILHIRTQDGSVLRMIGPAPQLNELARSSEWYNLDKRAPGREDYVERMIAFDVDQSDRLIAMISLEPMWRDKNRLRRALDTL